MRDGNTYLPEILAMLCTVIDDYASAITVTAYNLPRQHTFTDNAGYLSKSDKAIKTHVYKLREDIFNIFSSKKFLRRFPQMKQVLKLKGSNMEKMIIMMVGLGIKPKNIASLLKASTGSITVTRSKRKDDIRKIFNAEKE